MKKIILSLFVITCSLLSKTQAQSVYPFTRTDTITVSENGVVLSHPWVGGLNHAQFQMMDVNMDCLNDLIVFDRSSNELQIFVNEGDSATPNYVYTEAYNSYFPDDLDGVLLLKDYNGDGKLDILTHYSFSLKYYKNISDSNGLAFQEIEESIKYMYGSNPWSPFYWVRGNTGAMEDVDNDGDLDIINFPVSWAGVDFYENVSTHPDTLRLELSTRCWGKFAENSYDSIVLGMSCKGNAPAPNNSSRHSGGGIMLTDLNNDGLLDALYSDEGGTDIKMMLNGGDPTEAEMVSVEYNYPMNDVSIDLDMTPITYFVDLYNTGNPVMIAAPSSVTGGKDVNHIWLYENSNTSGLANYERVQEDFLVSDQIDVGTGANPVFFDVSGDGLEDMLVANTGYFDSTDAGGFVSFYTSKIAYYQNVGVAGAPEFELITNDWLGMGAKGYQKMIPAFGDLNNDGVLDMVVSQSNGYLSYYENMAAPGAPANFVLQADSFTFNNFGPNFSPALYDIDGDNLLDLVAGQKNGHIKVYKNMGDTSAPWFQTVITDTLGGIFNNNIYKVDNVSNVAIANLDGVNGTVLMVSTSSGDVKFYSGLDTNPLGQFTLVDSLHVSQVGDFGIGAARLGTSDSLTLAIGSVSGGVKLFELNANGSAPAQFYICETPADTTTNPGDTTTNPGDTLGVNELLGPSNFNVFPNPSNGQFNVAFEGIQSQQVTLRVIDLGGKTLFTRTVSVNVNETISIQPAQLPKGMVLVEIDTEQGKFYKRLIVQ